MSASGRYDFSGRTVLLSGATGGLAATVLDFFLDAGAQVIGLARQVPPTTRDRLTFLAADLTSAEEAARAVHQAQQITGQIDVLLHLAGAFAGGQAVAEAPVEQFEQMWDTNVRTAYHLCRAVLPGMIRQNGGRIIAVGSTTGIHPVANFAAYGLAKAALHHLVQAIAEEVKPSGITANVIAPGIIDTPANRQAMPQANPQQWVAPAEIAELMLYLCTDAARHLNGDVIPLPNRS